MQNRNLTTTIRLALLSALSFVLMFVGEIPIPGLVGAKFDLAEIPAVFAALTMGPVAGAIVVVVKILLFFISGKSQAGVVGLAANMAAGLSLVLAMGLVARYLKLEGRSQVQRIVNGTVAVFMGALSMTLTMFVLNAYIFVPLYMHLPAPQWEISSGWMVFNVVKGGLAGTAGLVLYSAMRPYMATILGRKAA